MIYSISQNAAALAEMGGVELQNRSSGSGCRYEVHPVLESLVCNSSTETDRVMKSRLLLKKKKVSTFFAILVILERTQRQLLRAKRKICSFCETVEDGP